MSERAFSYIRMNEREGKPRTRGITEIRGPYYTPMGKRYLEDVLETMGDYVDSLKFAGGDHGAAHTLPPYFTTAGPSTNAASHCAARATSSRRARPSNRWRCI